MSGFQRQLDAWSRRYGALNSNDERTTMNQNAIVLHAVDSSQINAIGHDPETNTLAIRFYRGFGRDQVPGSVYHYANFTAEDFEAFKNAESIGRHFGRQIKTFADKYPFTKVAENEAGAEPIAA